MISAAEKPDMDQQRPELVDWLPFLPSRIKATGVIESRRGLVKQAQHGKVDLAVAIIAGGVDQTPNLILVDEDIAAPKVAMEQCCCWRRRNMIRKAFGKPTDPICQMWLDMGKVAGLAVLGPEWDPLIRPAVGNGDRPEGIVLVPAYALSCGSMKMVQNVRQVAP